jgi:hypothetical protein
MLDECKGDKLMEVLAVLSTAVLRKVALLQTPASPHPPVATTLATATMLDAVQQGSLIPLSVAYCASISASLRRKDERKARLCQFSELLAVKSAQMEERIEVCKAAEIHSVDATEEAQIKKVLHDNWPGSSRWPQAVLYGDDVNTGDLPLQRRFQEVWTVVSNGRRLPAETSSSGLLESLERRVSEQSTRLQRWHNFHERFFGANTDVTATNSSNLQSRSAPAFRFIKHGHLRLGTNISIDYLGGLPPSASTYQTILANLARDISDASRCRRNGGKGWSRERSNTVVQVDDHGIFSPVKGSAVSNSHAFPSSLGIKPQFTAEDTHSEEPDIHIAIGEPNGWSRERSNTILRIPDNTLVAPIDVSPIPATQTQTQPLFLHPESLPTPAILLPPSTESADLLSAIAVPEAVPETAPLPSTTEEESLFKNGNFSQVITSSGDVSTASSLSSSEDENPAEQIISSVVNSSPSPLKSFTLAERTRMSMTHTAAPKLPKPTELLMPLLAKERDVPGVEITNRRASLLERTRQSMAHIPGNGVKSKKSLHRTSMRHSLFPVNQFETPGKVRTPAPEPRRDATPTEKLFSEDAEYTSVFKSRPKIALSPVWSPDSPDTPPPLDQSLDSDDDGQDEVWGSSPLANRRGIAN